MSTSTLWTLTLATLTQVGAAQPQDFSAYINEQFGLADSQLVRVHLDGALEQRTTALLTLGNTRAQIQLDPVAVVSDEFQLLEQGESGALVPVDPGQLRTYRGTVIGTEGSLVAASWLEDGLYARIRVGADKDYWLQPIAPSIAGVRADLYLLYETSDALTGEHVCGADLLANNQQAPFDPAVAKQNAGGGVSVAELGCDADFEYFQDYGSVNNVGNRIQSVINTMNIQYETEVDITHSITTILVRTSPGLPYTSTDAVTLLNQFRTEWTNNQGGIQRDVAQLFTGKELNGGTIGVAWLGVICNQSFGYGLVQSDFNGNFSCATDLSAHELGHNWNADHCNCTSNTMNPFITCANTFSPSATIPEIVAHRNSRTCLDTGGGGDLFSDDFESGSWQTGGWVLSDFKPKIWSKAAANGTRGASVRCVSWIEKEVDTTGFSNIEIQYTRRTLFLDAGEYLFVEWWDGGSWNLIEQTQECCFSSKSFNLPAAAGNNPDFKLRFRLNATRCRERGDVDDVAVIGS